MRYHRLYAANLAVLLTISTFAIEPVDHVSMMIGTDGPQRASYGGTWPGIGAPFAMTQWCAATRQNAISRTCYRYRDSTLIGFQATHQPAIWMADYGFITLMPQSGALKVSPEERAIPFSHTDEMATPYYYKVKHGPVTTEMTATSRCAMFRIRYPEKETAYFLIEAGRRPNVGGVEIIPERQEIRVYNSEQMNAEEGIYSKIGPEAPNFHCSYVLHFSKPFRTFDSWDCGCYVAFPPGTKTVEVRVGSSFIDNDQAQDNLDREIPSKASFETIRQKVRGEWNEKLSMLSVDGASNDDLTNLYTAYFRTLQYPREFSEYGRYYSPFDGQIHEGISYNDYSLWDTFRAEHPWLQLVCPERVDGMIEALIHMYEEGGWLPKWPNPTYSSIMIGSHADAVIADAFVNGFRNYDVNKAYEAVRKDAFCPPDSDNYHMWADRALWHGAYEARGGLSEYLRHGWVSSDRTKESVSRTLEFALDDWCIAQMASTLGHQADYHTLMTHAQNYRYIFRPETKFFNARKQDGKWDTEEEGFTEGAKWTYQFCVMQDPEGLINLMGGKEEFIRLLDKQFDDQHYVHRNEPGHHYVYLYDYANRLDLAQKRIPKIIKDNYHTGVAGLSGNDDCGQMSAWLLFSSLGFYPVTPASGIYALGIPAFRHITLRLGNGRTLTVTADLPATSLTTVTFNGQRLMEPFISVKDIMQGGVLHFAQ